MGAVSGRFLMWATVSVGILVGCRVEPRRYSQELSLAAFVCSITETDMITPDMPFYSSPAKLKDSRFYIMAPLVTIDTCLFFCRMHCKTFAKIENRLSGTRRRQSSHWQGLNVLRISVRI